MPVSWRKEVWWLILGAVTITAAGWLLGFPLQALLVAAIGYIAWMLIRVKQIVKWLSAGGSQRSAPPTLGMMDDIVRLVHREKSYSRKQKNRYKRSLLQFNNLASELPDATVVIDANNVIRWANVAARTLLNVHSDRDRGQRISNLIRDPDFHAFLQLEDPGSEIEMVAPSNSTLMLACRRIPSGRGMSVLVARDVTQRTRLREMRKDFVDDVSHELRTPLTVIRGYTEMLLENPSIDESSRNAIEKVEEQSNRMMHIVQKLLSLSRLEGNPLGENEGDVVAVADLVNSLVTDLRNTSSIQHEWVLELDETLALRGNYEELYSVVQNLLQNAVKYSGQGALIKVTWTQEDVLDSTAAMNQGATTDEFAGACLMVSDNGIGIEHRHLPRLSERFYRVDRARARESGGTGLGLAIVKHIAQRHGGQLLIDSIPGEGSEFAVHFPAKRVEYLADQASNF